MPDGQTRLTYCPANTAGVAELRLTCVAVSPRPPGVEEVVCVNLCHFL